MGSIILDFHMGPITFMTEFQIIDIPSGFNLLLGRVWLHEVNALPSSIHQKIKIMYKGNVIIIEWDLDRTITPKDSHVLGIRSQDVQLERFCYESNVQMLTSQRLECLPPDDLSTMN